MPKKKSQKILDAENSEVPEAVEIAPEGDHEAGLDVEAVNEAAVEDDPNYDAGAKSGRGGKRKNRKGNKNRNKRDGKGNAAGASETDEADSEALEHEESIGGEDDGVDVGPVVSNVSNNRNGNIRDGNAQPNSGGDGQRRVSEKQRRQNRANMRVESVKMPPVAAGSTFKLRHFMVVFSFLLMVVLPSSAVYMYLYERAADQYVSSIGFSVRKEEVGSSVDILGSISQISSGSSTDTDILYEFIQSQEQVALVDARLDLRSIYTKPDNDPLFALAEGSSLEELVVYWNRMVKVFYNGSNGLIQIRVHAFEAQDAKDIAEAIFEESTRVINKLSTIARSDATKYAKDELDLAVARLKKARQTITAFRNETQIVDPQADLQGQMSLINTLQQQLAEAIIEQDLLLQTTKENDPRNAQAARKVEVIHNRIDSERRKFGSGGTEQAEAYSTLIERYEGLVVELEVAEQFYVSSLTTYDAARAEAQRTSRYLAAYVEPTLAETPQYPKRLTILGLVTFFAFLIWSIVVMVGYSIRSRR
ncbi:sugar transporter [Planktotalea sp.]|uniref:sugar transporter n=1 Tax=Planktotalea sp. TaxID=2029877 RepID=UPI003D6B57BE